MIGSILCFFGIHSWEYKSHSESDGMDHFKCRRGCGKWKSKLGV